MEPKLTDDETPPRGLRLWGLAFLGVCLVGALVLGGVKALVNGELPEGVLGLGVAGYIVWTAFRKAQRYEEQDPLPVSRQRLGSWGELVRPVPAQRREDEEAGARAKPESSAP